MNEDNVNLSIFCNNVHRSNPITHAILQTLASPESKTNIVIITEPWIGTVRAETQEKGTVNHPDWRCITPNNIAKADVAVYYRKAAPFRITPLSHKDFAGSCLLPIEIEIGDDFSATLIAVYNSPTSHSAIEILQRSQMPESPTILCGDFNLHAPEWDSSVPRADAMTNIFQDWLTDNHFQVLNDPDKPTYHGHRFQYAKVDDLVAANLELFESYDISPIQVHDDTHFASDHYPISFEVLTYSSPLEQDTAHSPSLSETHHEEWTNKVLPTFQKLQRETLERPTPESLDRLSGQIMDAITDATQQVMPRRRNHSIYARHWWNEDLSQTIAHLRQLGNTVKQTRNPYLTRQYQRTKAVFRAKVRHAKRNWATSRLEGATSQTVWEFVKWYKHGGKRCRPLYTSPSNIPAPSDQDRAKIFADQFFPEPPPVLPFAPTDEPDSPRSFHPLIRSELESAIRNPRKDTAPGPSHINYTAVKWAWEAAPDLLFYLYSNCLELGHYPTPFKRSVTAVVPKPNKNNYTIPSAYRPIQLIECLGKILDKIIARRIQYEVAANDLVPHTQFGGRIHSSTIDAGLSFVQDIHDAWAKGMKATALLFDITGYFNAVNHDRLIAKLEQLGIDKNTTRLISSFLRDRSTAFSFDGFMSDPIDIRNGIPQGSPLSPILAIIYSAELQNLRQLITRRILSFAYIDDGALLTSSSSLNINVDRLRPAFEIVSSWLNANGLEVQPNKIELMHFTKGPDPSSPPLRLSGLPPIVAPKTIRWLGFHLDRHLLFTHHTKTMAARATATVRAMSILGNTVCRMSHVQLRQLVVSTITPVLTYGCQLWWGGRCSKANTARLQTALNRAMRLICRAFITTSVAALQYISHIPPLSHTIHRLCYSSSIRLHRLLPDSAILQRIPSPRPTILLTHRPSNHAITITTPQTKLSPLHRIARLTNASSQPSLNPILVPPWNETFGEHPRLNTTLPPSKDQREQYSSDLARMLEQLKDQPNTLVVATDGSRRRVDLACPADPNYRRIPNRSALPTRRRVKGHRCTGAGIHARQGNSTAFERTYGLGFHKSPYDGESFALAVGMKLAAEYCQSHGNISKIIFLSDSSSALTNITSLKPHPSQQLSLLFIKYAQQFLQNENFHISLQWIPGHRGHEVNERADKLARKGCKSTPIMLPDSLSYHAEKRTTLTLRKWREQFGSFPLTGAFGDVTSYPPTIKPSAVFTLLRNQPEVFGRLTQVRTMHGHNPSYLARFNIPHDPQCTCGHHVPPEPITRFRDHVFHNCEAYDEHRHILTTAHRDHSSPVLLGSMFGLLATAKFLLESGAFTATGRPYVTPKTPALPGLDLSELSNRNEVFDPP
jgi:ribonuclease HI